MVDNFEQIKKLLIPQTQDTFYHCQIIRRGKDHPNLPAANKLLKTWLVQDVEFLDDIKNDVITLCNYYQARAYINIAPKSLDKLNKLVAAKISQNVYNGNIFNPYKILYHACGELKPYDKRWIVDVDTKDGDTLYEVMEEIDGIWDGTHPGVTSEPGARQWYVDTIPTVSGYHLITLPFNVQKFKELFPDIDIHKNNPTLLFAYK